MAITLGTFTKLNDGVYAGTLKTLNFTATLAIDRPAYSRTAAGPRSAARGR
jgi:hypothetical protein